MISSTDFRTGLTIEIDNGVWQVVDFSACKAGQGRSLCKNEDQECRDGRCGRAYLQPE